MVELHPSLPDQSSGKVVPSLLVTEKLSRDDYQEKLRRILPDECCFANFSLSCQSSADPFAQQRILHRRIQSDPIFTQEKESSSASPPSSSSPSSNVPVPDAIPAVSYTQPDTCGSYGSSYDSRADLIETAGSIYRNKSRSLVNEQSNENVRHSTSSQITLTNEAENSFDQANRLSPVLNQDDTMFSTHSNSPQEQCVIRSTSSSSSMMRSKMSFLINDEWWTEIISVFIRLKRKFLQIRLSLIERSTSFF